MSAPAVELLAHRGASHVAPENTIAAFVVALDDEGADGIELDLRLTSDGVPVVFHDPDGARLCGVTDRIAATSLAALRGWRVSGEPIPTFEEVVAWASARAPTTINIELKPVAQPAALVGAARPYLERLAEKHTLVVSSFDPRAVALATPPASNPNAWRRGLIFDDLQALRILHMLPPIDLHPSQTLATAEALAAWAAPDRRFRVWTIDALEDARRLADLGVGTLITNRPGPLRAELAEPR